METAKTWTSHKVLKNTKRTNTSKSNDLKTAVIHTDESTYILLMRMIIIISTNLPHMHVL